MRYHSQCDSQSVIPSKVFYTNIYVAANIEVKYQRSQIEIYRTIKVVQNHTLLLCCIQMANKF
jgi:hypothetical protein